MIFKERLKEYAEVSKSLALVTFALPVMALILGYHSKLWISVENTRALLSTLAGAQAAVLAIVFSITMVGIQLIASRYSPRMTSLFIRAPILTATFAVFVFSIAVDLSLLYVLPEIPTRTYTGGVFLAGGLGVVTGGWLLVFIREMTHRSTPEGTIEAFTNSMTPGKYLKKVKESSSSESEHAHPMRPLYSMVMAALSNREHVTAKMALQAYGDRVEDVLETYIDDETFSEIERDEIGYLFRPVLEEHLPDIALHAEEKEETDIVEQAAETIVEIGELGLKIQRIEEEGPEELDVVGMQAGWGLCDIIRDARVDRGYYVASNSAWCSLGSFLKSASKHPRPEVVRTILRQIGQLVRRQLRNLHDIAWYQSSMRDLFNNLVVSHESLLKECVESLESLDIDWRYEEVPDDVSNDKKLKALKKCRDTIFETTGIFIEYYIEEGDYPTVEGNFMDDWKRLCAKTSKSGPPDYAVPFCQALIEATFTLICEDPVNEKPWIRRIAEVKEEGDGEIVERAFDFILRYEKEEAEDVPMILGRMDEYRENYYQNLVRIAGYRPLNIHRKFPELLLSIREKVEEETSS